MKNYLLSVLILLFTQQDKRVVLVEVKSFSYKECVPYTPPGVYFQIYKNIDGHYWLNSKNLNKKINIELSKERINHLNQLLNNIVFLKKYNHKNCNTNGKKSKTIFVKLNIRGRNLKLTLHEGRASEINNLNNGECELYKAYRNLNLHIDSLVSKTH